LAARPTDSPTASPPTDPGPEGPAPRTSPTELPTSRTTDRNVGPLIHGGKLSEVQAYCLSDVIQTAALFLRTQLARGILSLESYREAMVELFRQADLEPRITHVMAATNRSMVLLEDKGKPRP
jgi:hypothetical protein